MPNTVIKIQASNPQINGKCVLGPLPMIGEEIDIPGSDTTVFTVMVRDHIYDVEDLGQGKQQAVITLACGIMKMMFLPK